MTSYALARHLRPAQIYEALLAQDGVVLPHPGDRHVPSRKQAPPSMPRDPNAVGATARETMVDVAIVEASSSIDSIVEGRDRRSDVAFAVRDEASGALRVVPTELLAELLRDESLPGLVVVGELAAAAPTVSPDSSLDSVASLLVRDGASDAVVVDPATGDAMGVVRRVAVALALMESRVEE
jgi:predicted transcriptional regulator